MSFSQFFISNHVLPKPTSPLLLSASWSWRDSILSISLLHLRLDSNNYLVHFKNKLAFGARWRLRRLPIDYPRLVTCWLYHQRLSLKRHDRMCWPRASSYSSNWDGPWWDHCRCSRLFYLPVGGFPIFLKRASYPRRARPPALKPYQLWLSALVSLSAPASGASSRSASTCRPRLFRRRKDSRSSGALMQDPTIFFIKDLLFA